jgi:hypothetical protein
VLATTQDAGGAQTIIEGAGLLDHLGHIATVATATERVVGFVVEGNIEYGTEIEIESK